MQRRMLMALVTILPPGIHYFPGVNSIAVRRLVEALIRESSVKTLSKSVLG